MSGQQLVNTPVGTLLVKSNGKAITALEWAKTLPLGFMEAPDAVTQDAEKVLKNYFNKSSQNFDLKLEFEEGTDFQKSVWQALMDIPFGVIVTYDDLAKKLNSSPRAVGSAVGKNPIPIFAPCHRVIGKNGMLIGFSGGDGVSTKKQLLELEGAA